MCAIGCSRESARIKGKRYRHLLYSDEEVDDEIESKPKLVRKSQPKTNPQHKRKLGSPIIRRKRPAKAPSAAKTEEAAPPSQTPAPVEISPETSLLQPSVSIPPSPGIYHTEDGLCRSPTFGAVFCFPEFASQSVGDLGYPAVQGEPMCENVTEEKKVVMEEQDEELPGMEDESEAELKRSFSFCQGPNGNTRESKGNKRPPELDIELIMHSQCHPIQLAVLNVPSSSNEGTRAREGEPMGFPMLSPLAMPANYTNLASTPTLLSSLVNVFKKEPAAATAVGATHDEA